MVLTPKAAKEVCNIATRKGVFVGIVEGGHWKDPGFQPDMSRRWDSKTKLEQEGNFKRNNELAIENIDEDISDGYTAFLITLI
ncbi:colicin transporter [Leclercia sp. LK8]|nr:colicin transporter [Leclercia sp. LK8]